MWHTAFGDRVLENAEAKVFAESLLDLAQDEAAKDGGFALGIPVFASLTYPQQIAALHLVANALFRVEVPMPELTAVLEGTVAAVIENIYSLAELDVHADDSTFFRSLLAQACRELHPDEEIAIPKDSCNNMELWQDCTECLHDAILWDSDYLDEDNFVDLPPEHGEALKEVMGVDNEYFRAVAQDPSPRRVKALASELEALSTEVAKTGHPKASASPGASDDQA